MSKTRNLFELLDEVVALKNEKDRQIDLYLYKSKVPLTELNIPKMDKTPVERLREISAEYIRLGNTLDDKQISQLLAVYEKTHALSDVEKQKQLQAWLAVMDGSGHLILGMHHPDEVYSRIEAVSEKIISSLKRIIEAKTEEKSSTPKTLQKPKEPSVSSQSVRLFAEKENIKPKSTVKPTKKKITPEELKRRKHGYRGPL